MTFLTFLTPALKNEKIARHADLIALFAGLIFVSHPVQIEAVSYICQRAASLATLFYLSSLCLYIQSRLPPQHPVLRTTSTPGVEVALLTAVMAMFTKEIAITLPLMILLYEFFFFENKKLPWKRLFPFLLTLLIIPITMLLTKSKFFHEIPDIAEGPAGISPWHYLLTQFRVIVTYIRLLFLPFNQHLDYDYPLYKSIFEWPVLISFLFLISILWQAKCLFLKYRLVSFSILWFFLTLLPESSILPAKDLLVEHRLYLPMVGFSIFLASSMFYLLKPPQHPVLRWFILIVAFYSVLTYQRNKIWKDEFSLWDDSVQKSPHKARPYMSRGSEYFQRNDFDHAMIDYNKALELNPDYVAVYIDRANIYYSQGNADLAMDDLNKAIKINPNYEKAWFNRGKFNAEQGNDQQAIEDYTKAIKINPYRSETYSYRGDSYTKEGNYIQAIFEYSKAIEINPDDAQSYNNRGAAYGRLDNLTDAIKDFNKAIEIKPGFAEAYKNLTAIYTSQSKLTPKYHTPEENYLDEGNSEFRQGDFTQAIADYTEAVKINPTFVQAFNNRGFAYEKQKEFKEAIADFNKAIALDPAYTDAYYNRGLAFDSQGNWAQALSDFNKTIEINPVYAQVYGNRAIVEYKLEKYDKAREDVNKAKELGAVVNPRLIDALTTASDK